MNDRLRVQMSFLNELERLKTVYRRNRVVDRSRHENSAEHSWHLAVMALVLSEHADVKDLDLWRVVKMLLLHDVVEVYAGDTWAYDEGETASQSQREEMAARKLFALLPNDQADEFLGLLREFADRSSPEGAFAASIDALQPLSNHLLSGRSGDDNPAPACTQVLQKKNHIGGSSSALWRLAQELIEESRARGLYV